MNANEDMINTALSNRYIVGIKRMGDLVKGFKASLSNLGYMRQSFRKKLNYKKLI